MTNPNINVSHRDHSTFFFLASASDDDRPRVTFPATHATEKYLKKLLPLVLRKRMSEGGSCMRGLINLVHRSLGICTWHTQARAFLHFLHCYSQHLPTKHKRSSHSFRLQQNGIFESGYLCLHGCLLDGDEPTLSRCNDTWRDATVKDVIVLPAIWTSR